MFVCLEGEEVVFAYFVLVCFVSLFKASHECKNIPEIKSLTNLIF